MRLRQRIACLAGALGAAALLPAPALASLAAMYEVPSDTGPTTTNLLFVAGPEANHVTVRFEAARQVVISDRHAINIGGSCEYVDAEVRTAVRCDGKDAVAIEPPNIDLGGGNDVLRIEVTPGLTPATDLEPGAGNDDVTGGPGPDAISDQAGADVLRGAGGADTIFGQVGDDRLFGGPGNDRLEGGAGDDRLYGSLGNDLLLGGPNDDVLWSGAGTDRAFGGEGRNYIDGRLQTEFYP
jgi:hypothetical protein